MNELQKDMFCDKNRIKWIDTAKGVAIIFVILGHMGASQTAPHLNFNFAHGFHLYVFFLLSGFLCKKVEIDRNYLNKKFKRLMSPYFYTCFFITLMDVINAFLDSRGDRISITNIIWTDIVRSFFASGTFKNFGAVQLNGRIGAIWFFPALFFSNIIFLLLLNRVSDINKLGIISMLVSLIGYISAKFIWFPFSIQSGMFAVFFLWMGYYIRQKELLTQIRWWHYLIACFFVFVGIYYNYFYIFFVTANMGDVVISLISGIGAVLLVYLLSRFLSGRGDKFFCHLGENSLEILCTHLFYLETMGKYRDILITSLPFNERIVYLISVVVSVVFAIVSAEIIIIIKKIHSKYKSKLINEQIYLKNDGKRDSIIDIAKGLLIIFMLVGHFDLDPGFRKFIYSFHMLAFIFLSGYFHKSNRNIKVTLFRMIKTFIVPYILFVGAYILFNIKNINSGNILNVLARFMMGISFSNRYFKEFASVGPVYFILLLFLIRVIYLLIDKYIKKNYCKCFTTVAISFLGALLGIYGIWLPWSLDIALYGIVFYWLGYISKKHNFIEFIKQNYILYFVLSTVWAYHIYTGGMEIAIRNYGQYGIAILGSVCGTMIIIMLSNVIYNNMPIIYLLLSKIGQSSLYILMVTTIIWHKVGNYCVQLGLFEQGGMRYMIVDIIGTVVLGVCLYYIIYFVLTYCRKVHSI